MEVWKPKNQQMARSSKTNSICKKHPKHQQSPGVCSICLSEKLSQLSKGSRSNNTRVAASSCSSSSLSSSPSHCSSCAASSCSSPVHRRMASETRGYSMVFSRAGRNELAKSRSMAAVTRRREREGTDHGKKKSNFWSKLLRPKGKRIDQGLVHSRTMREMLPTRPH